MRLVNSLVRPARGQLTVAILAMGLAGAASLAQVALVNQALHERVQRSQGEWLSAGAQFAIASGIALGTRWLSEERFARLGQDSLARLRLQIGRHLAALPLRAFERTGAARFQATLTEDATAVAACCTALPGLLFNFSLVAGSLVYLASLSPIVFGGLLVTLGLGVAAYLIVERRAAAILRAASSADEQVFSLFGSLLEGKKELLLHEPRRRDFVDRGLEPAIATVRRQRARGLAISTAASSVGAGAFFVIIGVVVFALPPGWDIAVEVVSGYALVFLYLMFPLESLLGTLPVFERGRVALERIASVVAVDSPVQARASGSIPAPGSFFCLRLEGVTHRYDHEARSFTLGPIDLELRPGEITFLVGGNGSGKTSLAKLIAGLYEPQQGRVVLNGEVITDRSRSLLQAQCSAVFSDFHLFQELWGLSSRSRASDDAGVDGQTQPLVQQWLEKLGLETRVTVRGARFSTTALSQGQRKRLALLVAQLEERPILVLDEWAADQDPGTKEFFYGTLLRELAAAGKAVVVITHDDRYFEVSDHCFKLDGGTLTPMSRTARSSKDRQIAEGTRRVPSTNTDQAAAEHAPIEHATFFEVVQ